MSAESEPLNIVLILTLTGAGILIVTMIVLWAVIFKHKRSNTVQPAVYKDIHVEFLEEVGATRSIIFD